MHQLSKCKLIQMLKRSLNLRDCLSHFDLKKWCHRCLSICLLLLFHRRGSSQVPEKRNQILGTTDNLLTHFEWANADEEVFMCLLKEISVIVARCMLFRRNISCCQLPQYKEKETNTEQCRQQSSLAGEHRAKHLKNCYEPHLCRWITSKIYFFLSSVHSLLHHSIPYKFSHPCCPSQGIFPLPAVQTPLPFSGNNWAVGWSCCPASLCCLLDVLGSGTLKPLLLGIWRSLHHGLCIVFSVFDDDDGHKRVQTSRPVVGAEVQTNCNFEAHIYHCSYHLGFISCLFLMHPSWSSFNSTTLPGYFTRIIYKDFSHYQISAGSGRRSCSTTV